MTTPKLKLCCIAFPILTEDRKLKHWCAFCQKGICDVCLDAFVYDDYYHHEECRTVCPHTPVVHGEEDNIEPKTREEYT